MCLEAMYLQRLGPGVSAAHAGQGSRLLYLQRPRLRPQLRPGRKTGVSSCKVPGMELRALRLQLAIRLEYLGPKVYNTLDIDRTLRCEIPTVLDFQVFELYAGTLPVPSTQLRMSPERFSGDCRGFDSSLRGLRLEVWEPTLNSNP